MGIAVRANAALGLVGRRQDGIREEESQVRVFKCASRICAVWGVPGFMSVYCMSVHLMEVSWGESAQEMMGGDCLEDDVQVTER